jgi:dolichol-phosphate mannosyltransferase
MSSLDLSIVIPAYLEEANLRVLLPRLLTVLKDTQLSFEVLVVDTQDPLDGTPLLCQGLEDSVVHCPREGGNRYGDAIRTGIARARGKHILFLDADGSHPPEFIPRLLEFADDNTVVVASRYAQGGSTENPAALIWMSQMLNTIYRLVLQIPCRDVSNSFKLYPSALLKQHELVCDHFDIVEELLVRSMVARRTLRILEVPSVFKARMFGFTKRRLIPFIFAFCVTLSRLLRIKIQSKIRSLKA